MVTQFFDQQTEYYLTEILDQENISSDELIKNLIYARWQALQPEPIEPLKRKNSKQAIAEFVRRKNSQPV